MSAVFDAKSASQNFNAITTNVTLAHTIGGSGTVMFVIIPYFCTSATVGNVTGVTWNGTAMTKIGSSSRTTSGELVEIYGLAGPTTGTHNIIVTFEGTASANDGSVYGVSWTGTATTGTPWADFTSAIAANTALGITLTVPNNTANDGIIDGEINGSNQIPAMTAQTNRTLGASGSSSGTGNGEGWSYLAPGPAGNQVMDWTYGVTNTSAQAAIRVLASSVTDPFPLAYK